MGGDACNGVPDEAFCVKMPEALDDVAAVACANLVGAAVVAVVVP